MPLGAPELVVFDPRLLGPASLGGPLLFQLWRLDACGAFGRVTAGDGPIFSEALGCWLSAEGRDLVFSDDRDGKQRWLTREAYERAEKERERAEKERAIAEKERVERVERELRARLDALEKRGE